MAEKETIDAARAAVASIGTASLRFAAALDLYDVTGDPQDLEQARTVLLFILGAEAQIACSVELFARSRVNSDLGWALNGLKDTPAGYLRWKSTVLVVRVLAQTGHTRLAAKVLEEIPEPRRSKESPEIEGRAYFRDAGFEAIIGGYLTKGKPDMGRLLISKIEGMEMRAVACRAVYKSSREDADLLVAENIARLVGTPGAMAAVRETEVDAWLAVGDERRAATAAQKGATPEIRARLYHRILQHRKP